LLCTFAMRARDQAEPLRVLPPLVVRDLSGRRTPAFQAVRAAMGMPP